jgi:predicted transcriptional regulator of viral defense system
MPLRHSDRTLQLVRKAGVLRPRDLVAHGIPRQYLRLLEQAGKVQRSGRGLYTLTGVDVGENHTLAEACKRVPHGVVCLLSALRLHNLTTQLPYEVWMAVAVKARKPKIDYPPLRIVRFSEAALRYGVERRQIEGVTVSVYSPAKTVADCFKYRNKIGLEVALDALRDCRAKKKATVDDLWAAAKVCRVANVMRPYMEALVLARSSPPTSPLPSARNS